MPSYKLNERDYTVYNSLAQDICFEPELSYVFDLAHLGALEVSGENELNFLQGQLTCDIKKVNETHMRPGGMCTLQGRLISLLDVIAWHGHHLVMPQDLLVLSHQALAKTALFSRVNLKINQQFVYAGLYIPRKATPEFLPIPFPIGAWQATQNEDMYCYALSDQLFVFLFRNSMNKEAFLGQFPAQQHRGSLAWHYLELHLPRLTIYPNTRGLFLPHRLNLQTTPYLSFSKGCYKGQEIIARTHYRAKLKHSLKLFQITSSSPIFAGQKCYASPQETELGEIIDYCPIDAERYLIVLSSLFDHPNDVFFDQHLSSTQLGEDRYHAQS